MISRTVRLQLFALVLVTVIGVGYTGFRYAGLDAIFGATTYPVTVQLADSGGIFTGADVSYRGVSVGRVGPLTLTDRGVDVQLDIDNDAPAIPADTSAEIRNLSAIGEQYVDLLPGPEGGPVLAAGAVVAQNRTVTPVGVEDLVVNLDDLVRTVPLDSLRTVVSELGNGFSNTAQPLQQLLDTTGQFTQAATDALPQTTALIRDSRPVLTTQNQVAPQFKAFASSLNQVTDQLKQSDPDLRRIIADGPRLGDQVSGLLRESGPGLGESIANLRQITGAAGEPPGWPEADPGHLPRPGRDRAERRARRRHGAPRAGPQRQQPAGVHAWLRRDDAPRSGRRVRGPGELRRVLRGTPRERDQRAWYAECSQGGDPDAAS